MTRQLDPGELVLSLAMVQHLDLKDRGRGPHRRHIQRELHQRAPQKNADAMAYTRHKIVSQPHDRAGSSSSNSDPAVRAEAQALPLRENVAQRAA